VSGRNLSEMLPESPGEEGPLGSIALTTLLRDTARRRARESSPRRGGKGAFALPPFVARI